MLRAVMRTILAIVMIVGVGACGNKKKSEPQADPQPKAPAVETTDPAPAAPPTTGAIAGKKYKMNVRLGEQTAPPTLAPKDEAAAPVEDPPADPAARKGAAAKAAAAKAAREATQPR